MATPASVWTDAQVINQLNGGKWLGQTITFSFPTNAGDTNITQNGEATGFLALNASQQGAAQLAVLTWGDLMPQVYREVASGHADITFGLTNTGIEYAHAYTPSSDQVRASGTSVWFNSGEADLVNPSVGNYGFATYIHEMGHAIGLNHMGNYNGKAPPGGWKPSSWQDSTVYSVMSYFGPAGPDGGFGQVAWADWVIRSPKTEISPQTPMLNDVMAIQSIYGAATTRAEDTVYGFHTTISGRLAEIYDFNQNANPVLCIYDSAGNDTLDLSGFSSNSSVDLMGGDNHFSSCNAMTSNIQIARNVVIENAKTGAGYDVLIGNAVANILSAGDGNDLLRGEEGNDELIGGKNADELHGGIGDDVLRGGNGLDNLFGGVGNDILFGALGTDTLTGGAGNDEFRFTSALDGVVNIDTITDYEIGIDKIELSATVFSAFAGQVGSNVGLNQYLTYNAGTGVLSYDADGSGAGAALAFAIVGTGSHPASMGTDFWIIP